MKRFKTIVAILLISVCLVPMEACRKNVNTSNPQVVQAAALLDAANTCKTLEDGIVAANDAVEKLEASEPEYYAHVKPLLKKLSSANTVASQKINIVAQGGTADWKGALVAVGTSVTASDLTTFGFKNSDTQLIIQGSFALLVTTLSSMQLKFGSVK
jgi:hypothetical protein